MKKYKNTVIVGLTLITLFLGSCSDLLDEKPRSLFTPEYFKTEEGLEGGLVSLYNNLRYIYGLYYYVACEQGTDEYTWAQSADNNNNDNDLSGVGNLTPSSCRSDVLWNNVWTNINTASGIIENGMEGGISESLISEARFARAFDYFLLVQTFGGVPLDLGAGELKYNISATTISVRNTVPEVYTKAIFPDLKTAVENLPDHGRYDAAGSTATKTLARLYLAKAYLTYGWWLQNPNNIPTYPDCPRTDPDGHNAAWYFQEAYNMALAGINDPGPFGLQQYYYDVNLGSNDRNNEILLYADHVENEQYNQASLSYSNGTAPENCAGWFVTWNYTVIKSGDVSSVQRAATQALGRPWTRMAPTIEAITGTFADKVNDSRYDGTFVSVYRSNTDRAGLANPVVTNANGMQVAPGGAILTFLNDENPNVVYPLSSDGQPIAGASAIGAGTLPDRSDYVINPSGISRVVYPGLWKLGPYRTDTGSGLGQPNGASTRPWNIAKFSELYLIAAEAGVQGATGAQSARDLVNVLRARAGKWRWDNNGNAAKTADNSAAMVAATPAAITINYILAERSREFFGEGYRWYDLVRTQKWADIAGSYSICGVAYGAHEPTIYERTIDAHYYLRPIPQTQIDGLTMDDATKKAYQNPGY
ncbi:MAG: RagB/SusD family nutrient uptake outer membrane protein [Candidatus Azobacteroides sp.]|nr:RagB/SusD family nutrient uptake outer membrane protein [Candidatus Azobacteroides sp.]